MKSFKVFIVFFFLTARENATYIYQFCLLPNYRTQTKKTTIQEKKNGLDFSLFIGVNRG